MRWASRDHLHVTLRFLGEVPEASIPGVEEILGRLRAHRLASMTRGPRRRDVPPGARPRVVWAGVQGSDRAQQGALHALRRGVHEGSSALGFPHGPR